MKKSDEKSFVLSCDHDFKLIEILNEKNIKVNLQVNEKLISLISESDYTKFFNFMWAVKNEEAVFNYEMCIETQNSPCIVMQFGGAFINGQYIITAFSNYLDLYEELLNINNLQANKLRETMKKIFSTSVNYQHFMEINNDLINAKREAQKKNAIIEGLLDKTIQLNTELKELNTIKDRLFSIIGHDLRVPLANIISGLNLISSDQKIYEDLIKDGFFEDLIESTGLTMQILENLLEWSRIQLGERSFNPRRICLDDLLSPIIKLYTKIAKDKGIELIEKTHEKIELFADPHMLEVIISNLISNAIKFTKPSGTVILDVEVEKERLIISVEDNGVGMTSEKIANLFSDSFDNIERGTKGEKGAGFGLLLCNNLIKEHHGKLEIESTLGVGSKFSFDIPLI